MIGRCYLLVVVVACASADFTGILSPKVLPKLTYATPAVVTTLTPVKVPYVAPVVKPAPVKVPYVKAVPIKKPVKKPAPVKVPYVSPVVKSAPLKIPYVKPVPIKKPVKKPAPVKVSYVKPVKKTARVKVPYVKSSIVYVPPPTPAPFQYITVNHVKVQPKFSDCVPRTCSLNDDETSYLLQKIAFSNVGLVSLQPLLNERTIRVLFDFDVQARLHSQITASTTREQILNLEVNLLTSLRSPLLRRRLGAAGAILVIQAVKRNVQKCVQLTPPAVDILWAGYVYQVVDLRYGSVGVVDFLANLVLFLGTQTQPTSHPSPLAFVRFLEKRFTLLKSNKCKLVDAPKLGPLYRADFPKYRVEVKLVTVTHDGNTTSKVIPVPTKSSAAVKTVPLGPSYSKLPVVKG